MPGPLRMYLTIVVLVFTLCKPSVLWAQVVLDYGVDVLLHASHPEARAYFDIFNQFDSSFQGTRFDFNEARRIAEHHGMSGGGRIDKDFVVIERCSKAIPADKGLQELSRLLNVTMRAVLSPTSTQRLKLVVESVFTRNRQDVVEGRSFRMLAGALSYRDGYPTVMVVPLELWFVQMPYGSCKYPSYWLRAEAEGYWARMGA